MFPVKEVTEAILALRRRGYSSYLVTNRTGVLLPAHPHQAGHPQGSEKWIAQIAALLDKIPTENILNHDGVPKDRTKTVLLGASLISSSTPWLAKGDHRVKPGEVSWPRWARARATSWWVGVSSLVWMGGEEDPVL